MAKAKPRAKPKGAFRNTEEPELPNLPPGPWWRVVFKRLFQPVKLPAWAILGWSLFISLPDWDGRIRWWLEKSQEAGGLMGPIAFTLQSPLFLVTLSLGAAAWLVFVGEPEKHVRRDHRWRYLGWAIAAIFFGAIFITLINGAFEIAVEEAAAKRETPFKPWNLTPDQERALDAFVAKTPKVIFRINALQGSTQSQAFGTSLLRALGRNQWAAIYSVDAGLRPDIVGVHVSVPANANLMEPNKEADTGLALLQAMGISPGRINHNLRMVGEPGITQDTAWIVVGNKP